MAKIMDIARKAKVAPSTVSLVANGTGRISERTRRRVQQVIDQMGYKARRLRSAPGAPRSLDVAVLYVDDPNPSSSRSPMMVEYMQGINSAFAQAGIEPRLIATTQQIEQSPIVREHLRPESLHGVIVVGADPNTDNSFFQRLRKADKPLVVVNRHSTAAVFSSVSVNYAQGSALATQHLIEHGHRRIGFVGLGEQHGPSVERWRGHQSVLATHGLEPGPSLTLKQGRPEDRPAEFDVYCRRALAAGCTAMVMGDHHVLFAAEALGRLGAQVPRDMSLVGFDALGVKLKNGVQVTSVDYDKRYLGHLAVSTLLELIDSAGRISHAAKMVGTSLAAGDSVKQLDDNPQAKTPSGRRTRGSRAFPNPASK